MSQNLEDVTIQLLDQPAAWIAIGAAAAQSLKSAFKRTGLYVDQTGAVRTANPAYVYFDPRAFVDAPDETKLRRIRRIMTDGQPLLVIQDDDGTLWEAEPIEEKEP